MSPCPFSEQLLFAWVDGEAGSHTAAVQAHVDGCLTCRARLLRLKQAQRLLIETIEQEMGPVEPLIALQHIRQRAHHYQKRSPLAALGNRMDDLWLFHRRAVLLSGGIALGCAGALGCAALWLR